MVKNNKKGFTLIELLIVSTIIIVLSGTSLALFSTYKDDRVLNAQVSILSHTLELAKNKATAGDVALCSSSSTAHVDGYTVTISSTNITLLAGCIAPTPINYSIPTNVAYVSPSLPFSIHFDNQNYQGGTQEFIIKNISTSKCKFVQIDETGLITNGDRSCP